MEKLIIFLVKFTYEGEQYQCEVPIECGDDWMGINVNDELAFDVNVWNDDVGEPFRVAVYLLDPNEKVSGNFTMNNMKQIHNNKTVDYFEVKEIRHKYE